MVLFATFVVASSMLKGKRLDTANTGPAANSPMGVAGPPRGCRPDAPLWTSGGAIFRVSGLCILRLAARRAMLPLFDNLGC